MPNADWHLHDFRSALQDLAEDIASGDHLQAAASGFWFRDVLNKWVGPRVWSAWGLVNNDETGQLEISLYWPIPSGDLTGTPAEWVALFVALENYV